MVAMSELRDPYVGSGADGALRSAWIDESEADTYDLSDPRRADALDSARRWREQAEHLSESEGICIDAANAQPGPLVAAAIRYDQDPAFRAAVDGENATDLDELTEADWDAIEAAGKLLPDD